MKKLLMFALVGALAGSVFADDDLGTEKWWTPLQINLASPLGLPWSVRDVHGIRVNLIYGRSLDVNGIDVGLVSSARGSVRGIAVAGNNHVEGYFRGVQAGALANFTGKTAYGIQVAGVLNWCLDDGAGILLAPFNVGSAYDGIELAGLNWNDGASRGLALGCVNVAKSDFTGCSIGALNHCGADFGGVQIGVFNMVCGQSEGVQIGAFNAAEDHVGVQIGIFNLNTKGVLPIMPVINANF